jgi:hypothetical protein
VKRKRNSMEKSVLATILILLIATATTWADDYIYDRPYGGKKVGRVDENGFVYDGAFGGKKIGRVKNGQVYDRAYDGSVIGESDSKDGVGYCLLEEGEE